ncbi:family 16 glycosylhydrolase [Rhizobium sp. EC-SD404]|uniref:endo-1,3-1,4-beta-glycanase ExoK n=1 Tax=Rhizobium sp. EC-SD404 TaxID=2038389 RepID=UPI00125BEDE1|nr:family 16 glycosylhydrolase [Rhizobium sp. EC-SD404]VVT10096.1 Endo-1,3-1,4-beta-glycanase ExoK [Rhizobium sp. EC-SD404]
MRSSQSAASGCKLILPALLVFAALPAEAQEVQRNESFVENFDDRLHPARWYISDGWNNGDHQNCTWSKDQVSVEDGLLKLAFESRTLGERDHVCAEAQTHARFHHGTYEVRMKAVEGSGLNTGFFTYIGPVHKQPHDEIDFEVLGKDPSRVQVNQYVDGENVGAEKLVPVDGGAASDFNDYAFVWEEGRIAWYVNGDLVHEETDPARLPSHPSKIYMSVWGSDTLTSWMGAFEDSDAPRVAEIDRVSFTALGEECQYPESLVCMMD